MAVSVKKGDISQPEAAVTSLKERLVTLNAEAATARQVAEQSEAAWRSALADDRLGEGGKAAVKSARAVLDAARENALGLEGAVAEVGRRLSAAEAELLDARLAALVARADKGVAKLEACIGELLELDAAAGKVRSRMTALIEDLTQTKEAHRDLDPEERSPGEIGELAQRLGTGLAQPASGNIAARGNIALANLELGWFLQEWRQYRSLRRVLGEGKEKTA